MNHIIGEDRERAAIEESAAWLDAQRTEDMNKIRRISDNAIFAVLGTHNDLVGSSVWIHNETAGQMFLVSDLSLIAYFTAV